MINRYMQQISDSVEQRKYLKIKNIGALFIGFSLFLLFYIFLALIIAPENRLEYHFVKESGIITAFSSVLLAFASGFAGLAFFLSEKKSNWFRFFWFLCFLGFLFFALDELLGFHELVGKIMRHELGRVQSFRNWNDIIVISYGIIAIPIIALFIPEILRFPKVAEIMAVAFIFYVIHTAIDSISQPSTPLSGITEESAKLFSSGFFAFSMFVTVLGMISIHCNNKQDVMEENESE